MPNDMDFDFIDGNEFGYFMRIINFEYLSNIYDREKVSGIYSLNEE